MEVGGPFPFHSLSASGRSPAATSAGPAERREPVDCIPSSEDDAQLVDSREPEPAAVHRRISGHNVRLRPAPASRSGSPMAVKETGTSRWMRKNGTPKRVREDRAIKGDLQSSHASPPPRRAQAWHRDAGRWVCGHGCPSAGPTILEAVDNEAEVIDAIHHNHKTSRNRSLSWERHAPSARPPGPLHQPCQERPDPDRALCGGHTTVRGSWRVLRFL